MIKFLEREKNVHRKRINFGLDQFIEEKYKSHNYNLMTVNSFWISRDNVDCFYTDSDLLKYFLKEDRVLFLIHPASENYFKDIIPLEPGPVFKGYSTSSLRTLLLFNEEYNIIFFGKLSLDRKIDVNRTIPKGEISRSIGTTKILDFLKSNKQLHKNFSYFREILGIIPKFYERGGMIIREIDEDCFNNKIDIFPAFSLCVKNYKDFLIFELFKKSKYIYFDKYLQAFSDKFIEVYLHLYKLGISMEPHAQNLLIKIKNGKMSFIFRDFGGFNIDLKKYDVRGLPFIENINEEYHQDKHIVSLSESLSYFNVGVLMEICYLKSEHYNKCNHYIQIKKSLKKYCKKYNLDIDFFYNLIRELP